MSKLSWAALWPLLGSVAMAIVLGYRSAVADAHIGPEEWVLLVTQVLMTVSVWAAANITGWERGKTYQAAIFTVLALLASSVSGGLTGDEITQLIVTALSALGVAATGGPVHAVRSLASRSAPGRNPLGPSVR